MAASAGVRVVVTDANVLINLMHAGRLGLLGALTGYEFVVPDHVVAEIKDSEQRRTLDGSIEGGVLRVEAITEFGSMAVFAELRDLMGAGEAACLAIACGRGWIVASDEKGAFRREAIARLGEGRIITTAGLLLLAIQQAVITADEADEAKTVLERHRFRMDFESFRDLLGKSG